MIDVGAEKLVVTPGWLAAGSAAQGELHIISLTGAHSGLRVKAGGSICRRILDLADGSRAAHDVLAHFDAEQQETVSRLLTELRASGVLGVASTGYADAPEQRRYVRQIEYFEDLTADQARALEAQRALAARRVAVIGVGGVGSWVLMNLATVGVKRFVILDPDRVELSNLSRQVIYGADDQGARKVEAAARWLRRFEPDVEVCPIAKPVHTAADLQALLPPVDAVIRTAGYVPSPMGREANRFCLERECAYLSVGGSSWGPLVGGRLAQAGDACFGCFEQGLLAANDGTFAALSDFRRQVRDTHSPVFGPIIGLTSTAAVADFALDTAGLRRAQARGGVVRIARSPETRHRIPVGRHDACPDCGGSI